jgi:hypothetical protein
MSCLNKNWQFKKNDFIIALALIFAVTGIVLAMIIHNGNSQEYNLKQTILPTALINLSLVMAIFHQARKSEENLYEQLKANTADIKLQTTASNNFQWVDRFINANSKFIEAFNKVTDLKKQAKENSRQAESCTNFKGETFSDAIDNLHTSLVEIILLLHAKEELGVSTISSLRIYNKEKNVMETRYYQREEYFNFLRRQKLVDLFRTMIKRCLNERENKLKTLPEYAAIEKEKHYSVNNQQFLSKFTTQELFDEITIAIDLVLVTINSELYPKQT